MNDFEVLEAEMSERMVMARRSPTELEAGMPVHPSFATAWILARKCREVDELPAQPNTPELSEMARMYRLASGGTVAAG